MNLANKIFVLIFFPTRLFSFVTTHPNGIKKSEVIKFKLYVSAQIAAIY